MLTMPCVRIILCHHRCEYSDVLYKCDLKADISSFPHERVFCSLATGHAAVLTIVSSCITFTTKGRHSQRIGAKLTPEKKRVFPACRKIKIQTFEAKKHCKLKVKFPKIKDDCMTHDSHFWGMSGCWQCV